MDVRLSPEQQALRDAATRIVADLGPRAVGELDDDARAAKLDAAVAAAGWRELRGAGDEGRPWATGVEVAVVAEELGRAAADVAFLGPTLAADLRRRAGLPAATEPETVLLSADMSSFAGPDTVGALAVDAAGATTALAIAGGALASVPLGAAEVTVDLTRPVASPAGAGTVLGGALTGDDLVGVRALGLAIACADLAGVMRGAVDLAAAYATERRQYGQPVGAFQAVQHLLADAHVAAEGARSAALHAAWAVDALPATDALLAAAVAKAYAGRAARSVCEAAIQVHGGIGNTWECMAHVFLRRALLSTDLLGGVDAALALVLDHHLGDPDGLR